MNPFDKQSVKRAAWKAAKNPPESGSPGWLIVGIIILVYLVKEILGL